MDGVEPRYLVAGLKNVATMNLNDHTSTIWDTKEISPLRIPNGGSSLFKQRSSPILGTCRQHRQLHWDSLGGHWTLPAPRTGPADGHIHLRRHRYCCESLHRL